MAGGEEGVEESASGVRFSSSTSVSLPIPMFNAPLAFILGSQSIAVRLLFNSDIVDRFLKENLELIRVLELKTYVAKLFFSLSLP